MMIIKPNQRERELLKEQLLKLIKENESDLTHATDDDLQSGIFTFGYHFSVNRALIERAIEKIREEISQREYDEMQLRFSDEEGQRAFTAQEEEEKLDSIGPELLGENPDDVIPF
jgi:hypothetical protein